jgi:Uma2 family endonuclease
MPAGLDVIAVPASVRFPVELEPPPDFRPDDPASWPRVDGRLEWVGGRLLYMPPCGARQQGVAIGVATVLGTWGELHPEFFVGGNEAGMLLGDDARGAEGAVWSRASIGTIDDRYVRVPPILAVEVAGRDDGEPELRAKARWYLEHGTAVVWLVLPARREVVVLTSDRESRHTEGDRLPAHPALPDLAPDVARFFRQLG